MASTSLKRMSLRRVRYYYDLFYSAYFISKQHGNYGEAVRFNKARMDAIRRSERLSLSEITSIQRSIRKRVRIVSAMLDETIAASRAPQAQPA